MSLSCLPLRSEQTGWDTGRRGKEFPVNDLRERNLFCPNFPSTGPLFSPGEIIDSPCFVWNYRNYRLEEWGVIISERKRGRCPYFLLKFPITGKKPGSRKSAQDTTVMGWRPPGPSSSLFLQKQKQTTNKQIKTTSIQKSSGLTKKTAAPRTSWNVASGCMNPSVKQEQAVWYCLLHLQLVLSLSALPWLTWGRLSITAPEPRGITREISGDLQRWPNRKRGRTVDRGLA